MMKVRVRFGSIIGLSAVLLGGVVQGAWAQTCQLAQVNHMTSTYNDNDQTPGDNKPCTYSGCPVTVTFTWLSAPQGSLNPDGQSCTTKQIDLCSETVQLLSNQHVIWDGYTGHADGESDYEYQCPNNNRCRVWNYLQDMYHSSCDRGGALPIIQPR